MRASLHNSAGLVEVETSQASKELDLEWWWDGQ